MISRTRTYDASRWSSRVLPISDALIVAPASETIRRTFPQSSITAFLRPRFATPGRLLNRVDSAPTSGASDEAAGLVGSFGGRSWQVGSARDQRLSTEYDESSKAYTICQ